jgi:2-oxoglutarate ferredoxin oxidoreductase subunit gamma
MNYEIILAGFGGQGILSAGRIISVSAILEGRNTTWFPSYGPEMRGGTANCHVIVSDDEIGSPIINNPDILIAMTLPALEKFEKVVRTTGFIIADSSLIDEDRLKIVIKFFL